MNTIRQSLFDVNVPQEIWADLVTIDGPAQVIRFSGIACYSDLFTEFQFVNVRTGLVMYEVFRFGMDFGWSNWSNMNPCFLSVQHGNQIALRVKASRQCQLAGVLEYRLL